MKVGVLTVPLSGQPLPEALSYLRSLGVEALEIGCGGYPGKGHCNPRELLENKSKLKQFKETIEEFGMPISALGCHGNMVNPDKEAAARYQADFDDALLLAEELEINKVLTFSGCPGDCPESKRPNWVTCAWPNEYGEILEWQWNEVLIPYWKKAAEIAKSYGVKKIAFEMHPGFCVYNPRTLLRLREAVGDIIGANFDPSHLIWQGMDPVAALRELKGAVYHFHAKDTQIMDSVVRKNGVLDTKSFTEAGERSWIFRTLGYGHGEDLWKQIFSLLKIMGYDDSISIEHEDGLMSPKEGLEKAIKLVKESIIRESNTNMWWA